MVISDQKYIEYYEYIINNDSFSDQKKCGLLSILMMYNSVYDDEYLNGLEELEYDNGIYILIQTICHTRSIFIGISGSTVAW